MNLSSLRNALLSTVVSVAALSASPAWAIPIEVAFNFVPTGTLTANTGDVTTATTITPGAPDRVTTIITDNTGLISGTTIITLTDPTPVTLGAGAPLLPRRIELRLDELGRNGDFASARFSVVRPSA